MAKRTATKRVLLYRKINEVSKLVPQIECKGAETEGDDSNEVYYYTEAAEVFKQYTAAFIVVGMTFLPVKIRVTMDGRFYRADIQYEITDIETGYSIHVVGSGLGGNGAWSVNSAQTVAKKQALLNAFGCSYNQPESMKGVVRRLTKGFKVDSVVQVMSSKDVQDEMLDYFGEQLKGKDNDTNN